MGRDSFEVNKFRVFDSIYSAASDAAEIAHQAFRKRMQELIPRLWIRIKDPETGYEYEFRSGSILVKDADGEVRKLLPPGNGDDEEILDIVNLIIRINIGNEEDYGYE